MPHGQHSALQMPSFLHGTYSAVQQKTRKEGLRCSEEYKNHGTFSLPQHMLGVSPEEVVLTQGVADFQHGRPVWRLYMVSDVMSTVWEVLEDHDSRVLRDAFESFFWETPWGALYFALEQMGPVSAACTAPRLQAVLRYWEPLQSARYLFNTLGAVLTLEQLMVASCGWAMDAWCPGDAPVRERLEQAAKRMAVATREDSIEAILRQLPRALASERSLKHRQVLADPVFQRERVTALDDGSFERASGACTSDLIGLLLDWDKQLGAHQA